MSLSTDFQKVHHKIFERGEQQAAVVHLGQLAISDVAPADIMAIASSLVTQVLSVEYSLIWELVDGGKNLLLAAGAGVEEGPAAQTQIPLDPVFLEGYTLKSPHPVIVEDSTEESRFRISSWFPENKPLSGVSLLIGTVETPLGIMEVFSRYLQSFSPDDVLFLQSVANILGLVLHRGHRELNRTRQNQFLRKELVKARSVNSSGQLEWDRFVIKNRLIESRERERLRLAQELHDSPIQDLYGLIYQLDDLRDILRDSDGIIFVKECGQTVQKVVNSLRTICRELRPPSLSPFGLEVAIRDHVEKFREQYPDIKVHLELMRDKQALSDSLRLSLFRIYQQAIHNVVRHAQATEVHIRFRWDEEMIILEVEDNGRGFEVPKQWVELVHEEHFGLLGIAEQVESMGGKLEILSAVGNGTLLRALLPRP